MLKPGDIIDNATLCRLFGVANSGGMRRSLANFHVVVVADRTRRGVKNRWDGDGLHYTGQGKGDQKLEKQNRTLARSTVTGERLHLFEVHRPGEYTYRGQVALAGEPYIERQLDGNMNERSVWMFPLRLVRKPATLHLSMSTAPKNYLPAGAHAVVRAGFDAAKLPEVHAPLDRLRALGVDVVDQRDVDRERYGEAMNDWHAEIEADMRRRARGIVREMEARARATAAPWSLTADELDIDEQADEERIREVLALIGRPDEFDDIRRAAYESGTQPEPPADTDDDPIDEFAELRAQLDRRKTL